MSPPQRSTSVTVIGWAWAVFAVLFFCFSIILLEGAADLLWGSLVGWFLLLVGVVLAGVATAGGVATMSFLVEKAAWSRTVLEWLTWILLGIAFVLALLLNLAGLTAPAPYVAGFSLAVNVTTLIVSVLLVGILAGLRSDTVRAAMVQQESDKSDRNGSERSDG